MGGSDTCLSIYQQEKENITRHAIGKDGHLASGYTLSVFAAWGTSISVLQPHVARFLHLLCFLDATNLTKELFKRACTTKSFWNTNGEEDILYLTLNGVPQWLLEIFCDSNGNWSDLKFFETTNEIASLFFLRIERNTGTWMHSSGHVKSEQLTSDGSPLISIHIPRPLHLLGKYYCDQTGRQQLYYEAFSIILQAFQNDIHDPAVFEAEQTGKEVAYASRGGIFSNHLILERELSQMYRHILVFQSHAFSF